MIKTQLTNFIHNQLDEYKAKDILDINIQKYSNIADFMIIATATSKRHASATAKKIVNDLKENDFDILGVEGEETGDWILIDAGDVIVHLMLDDVRSYYELEKLWQHDSDDSH